MSVVAPSAELKTNEWLWKEKQGIVDIVLRTIRIFTAALQRMGSSHDCRKLEGVL
jgi:hypothetical protein